MTVFNEKNQCSGCGACAWVCGKNAIQMVADQDGFLYPQIDAQACVECGKCRKVCPFPESRHTQPTAQRYLSRHKDARVCTASTSGGMYTALSEPILEQGGAVYGAAYEADMTIRHICMEDGTQRDRARGSKYIQSDASGVYGSLLEQLKADRPVIFFGTPCQVAAVRSLVPGSLQERLYTVDLICNGVGSPRVWKQHIRRLEEKFGQKICHYWFRPKTRGYLTASEVCRLEDGTCQELRLAKNMINSLYYNGLIHRPSCNHCGFAASSRTGDITLGDFSKLPERIKTFQASLGASTVLVNTEKGKYLLDMAREAVELLPVTAEECHQIRLLRCAQDKPQREMFLQESACEGIDRAWKKQIGLAGRLRAFASAIIRGVRQ